MVKTLELALRSIAKQNKEVELRLGPQDYAALTNTLANDSLVLGRGFGEYKIGGVNLRVKKCKTKTQ